MYFLFKCWHERLYSLAEEDYRKCSAKEKIETVEITEKNAHLVRELRGEIYEGQFLSQLAMGDFGYYAYLNGVPVGYGWKKHEGSDDFFFRIGESARYLCRFFVHDSARGKGIYPEIITALIEREGFAKNYYIAVERGNTSSERGLAKVGFKFVKEYGFIRGFKHTFNKKTLK